MVPSRLCHSQSMPITSSYSYRATSHGVRNTPRFCHRWKYRCRLLPEPNSGGTAFQWHPVRRT
jgi:hypothetical protein